MTKFIISEAVFKDFPDYICGVVGARNLNNVGASEEIHLMIRNAQNSIRNEFSLEKLSQNPFIQNWRNAYSHFGSQPSRYKASSEALIRRTLKGEDIPHINKLVDAYNYISLKYRTPVGGEDIDKMLEPLYLRYADGTEKFVKLGQEDNDPISVGEVIYVDSSNNVLCRRWNWRESEITKLTEQTRNAILVIEAMPPLEETIIKDSINELESLVKKFCNCSTSSFLLTSNNKEIEF